MILVIPAIDIKDGKCIRLIQGKPGTETVYSDDPVEVAKLWRRENAKALHVVDLDGALEGKPKNFDIVKKIVHAVDIPIEFGGGLRTPELAAMALDAGVYRITLGTIAVENPSATADLIKRYGPRRIALSIDVQGDTVYIKGWKEGTPLNPVQLAERTKKLGFERVIYTDISRDGTLSGPDLESITRFAEATHMRITFSGGISCLDDLLRIQALEPHGVDSVIIGKALYENRFACQELWRIAELGTLPQI